MSFKLIYWPCWVLVASRGIFHCSRRAPECMGSVVATCRLSYSKACGILLHQPKIEPVCPALQGRFLTTDHQESPHPSLTSRHPCPVLRGQHHDSSPAAVLVSGDPRAGLAFPGDHGYLSSWARADAQKKCLCFLTPGQSYVKQLSRPPCQEVLLRGGG